MMRIIVVLALACFGSGVAMYHVALDAQTDERAIAELRASMESVAREQSQYQVLLGKALNPEYLRTMADRHLKLQRMTPQQQIASIDDLPMRADIAPAATAPAVAARTPAIQTADASAVITVASLRR